MNASRKRRGSPLSPSQRPTRRRNVVVAALSAAIVVAVAVAAGTAHALHAPRIRQKIYEPRRLSWEEHLFDLQQRKCFDRYYRMPLETFEKLVGLLRPKLERNAHMARELSSTWVASIDLYVRVPSMRTADAWFSILSYPCSKKRACRATAPQQSCSQSVLIRMNLDPCFPVTTTGCGRREG